MNASDPTGIKGSGGNAWIAIVIVLLLGAAAAILYFVSRRPTEPERVQPVTTATVPRGDPPTTLDLPPIEPPRDADVPTAPSVSAAPRVVSGCPATCTGSTHEALNEALRARAGTAKQCYKTAIEGNEGLSGEITMLIRVGTDGSPCAVNVVSDTTGSTRLQQCARSKMFANYPAPRGGCTEVRVPIQFKPQK